MNDFKLTKEEIEKLCIAGSMAPSGGNSQPWLVTVINGNTFELKLDKKRSESFLDVGKYASFFALGCFSENLLIAAEWLGLKYEFKFLGYRGISEALVKIVFTARQNIPRITEDSLYPYIEKRVTNRQFYDGTSISGKNIQQLKKCITNSFENYKISTLALTEEKTVLAEILGRLDVIRILNDNLFQEMVHEIRWSEEEVVKSRDGLDIKTLELPQNAAKALALLKKFPSMRRVLPRSAFKDMAKPVLLGASHLCCLSVSLKLLPETMFNGGRALEKLWLEITKLGFSFQPWTIFTFFMIRVNLFKGEKFSNEEVEEIKKAESDFRKVFKLEKDDIPIFIFRLSKSKSPSARSLRLGWEEFTEIE